MTILIPDPFTGIKATEPWAAENFQVSKNGARYYADQMPPCDLIADPHADPVPGFSSLKPSKPFRKSVTIGDRKYTVPLDWHRAGEWVMGYEHSLDPYDQDVLRDFYQSANVQRDRDFARGHAIHRTAEAILLGKPTNETNPDAQPYLPHLIAWLGANVTDVYALEAVVFGDGYGGTGDGWLGVRGVACYVDFKSRGTDSAHGIYEEEVAQGGAYTGARYCILPSDDRQRAVRAPLPAATYGLVLSIRPDGVAEYWYELDKAREAFAEMHHAYRATSQSGKLARAAKVKDPTSVAETAKRMPKMTTPTVAATVTPDEGAELDKDDPAVVAVRTPYKVLRDAKRDGWINDLRLDAQHAHADFHLSEKLTMRRARIMAGLIALAEADCADDDVVKALVRLVTGEDAMQWPTITAGAAVGALSAVDAAMFVEAATAFVAGRYHLELTCFGPTVRAVAA